MLVQLKPISQSTKILTQLPKTNCLCDGMFWISFYLGFAKPLLHLSFTNLLQDIAS